MAQFSGTVKIGEMNDFIAPSQACVVSLQGKPLDGKPPAQLLVEADADAGKVVLHARAAAPSANGGGGFRQTFTPGGGDEGPVKVTLNDCLACSGCVTSAETVLLEAQSVAELAAKLTEPGAVVVVSVSPQSRASLAALHGLTAADVQSRLTTALRQAGVAAVLDLGVAKEIALAEALEEFVARWRHARRAKAGGGGSGGTGGSSSNGGGVDDSDGVDDGWRPGPLPMLASACPGWVCYAEKTQAGSLLPHISAARSPQAVMGALVKRWLAPARGWDLTRVYHATVMPCYDKKLEAAREDFAVSAAADGAGTADPSAAAAPPGPAAPEVDSSLTTGELQQLLEGLGLGRLAAAPPTPLDTLWGTAGGRGAEAAAAGLFERQRRAELAPAPWEALYALPPRGAAPTGEPPLHESPGGSGGYFEAVLRAAASRLLGPGALPAGAPLPVRQGRNPDMREASVEAPPFTAAAAAGGEGQQQQQQQQQERRATLRFAAAHGFRNIQSVVRKARLGRCEHDYVEVMACPGGCLNGGGQLKPRPGVTAAQLLDELESLYYRPPAPGSGGEGAAAGGGEGDWRPPLSAASRALYREWVGGGPGSAAARRLLHATYRHRGKTALGTVGDW